MTKPIFKKILMTTSTFPSTVNDAVPAFVRDEAIWFKKTYPELTISVLAPHNAYSNTKKFTRQEYFDEYRFHYFWPFRFEKLTGRGIQPALKKNKLLYVELPWLFIFEFFATWKLVRRLKPDIIYAHWFTPQAITSAIVSKITKVPYVFDTQASDAIVLKHVPFSSMLVAWVCRNALAYTAPSQQTIDKLLYFSTDKNREQILSKLHRIPYGTAPVKVAVSTVKAIEKKYHLHDKKVLYFIGRLVDRKGIDILLKAFSDLVKNDPSLFLVIVGDGQDKGRLLDLSRQLDLEDHVAFPGYISGIERFAFLELADICVIPSVNIGDQAEGLPVVFMEAVTQSKIVVLTDATGAHEVVKDSHNAFIAKAGSIKSLKEKISQALSLKAAERKRFKGSVDSLAKNFQWPYIVKSRYNAFSENYVKSDQQGE